MHARLFVLAVFIALGAWGAIHAVAGFSASLDTRTAALNAAARGE